MDTTSKEYQLIEEDVHDVEYHARKRRRKLCLLLLCMVSFVGIACAVTLYILYWSTHSVGHTSNSQELAKCPLNPQYPMLGGPGCKAACGANQNSSSLNFEYSWPQFFRDQINASSMAMLQFAADAGVDEQAAILILDEIASTVHMTLEYFCCLDDADMQTVNDIAANFSWPAMEISFQKVICTQDGSHDFVTYGNNSFVEVVVYASNASQAVLMEQVNRLEQAVMDQGIEIKVPRKENIGFHVTIGFANGTLIDVPEMVRKLNEMQWQANQSIVIDYERICTVNKKRINGVSYSCVG